MYKNNMADILEEIPKAQMVMLTHLAQDYDILKICKLNQTSDEILSSGSAVRKCRFCGNTEPAVKFRKRAHAISELCGSHHLLSDYECDSCNGKFSKYERAFSQFMLFYHSILGVEGKKGVPKYQRNRNETTGVSYENGKASLRSQVNEAPFFSIKCKDNKVTVAGTRTYVPIDVYRALLKMALTVMPESEIQYLQDTLRFLCDKSFTLQHSKQVFLRVFTGGMNVIRPSSVQLYKRKAGCTKNLPAYLFALSYSNFTFQMFLPGCSLDAHLKNVMSFNVPIIPTVADGVFSYNTEVLHLHSNQKVLKEPIPVTFSFEKMEAKWLVPWHKRIRFYAEQMWYGMKRKVRGFVDKWRWKIKN